MRGFLVFLIFFVAPIVALVLLRRGEALRFTTASRPANVVMTAIGTIGTKRRWATVTQSEQQVAFSYSKGPNWLIAIFLLMWLVVPGLVYLFIAGKRESLNVFIQALDDGSSTVQVTSNGFRGKSAGRALQAQLGVAPSAAVSAPVTPADLPSNAGPLLGELPRGEVVPPMEPIEQPAAEADQLLPPTAHPQEGQA